MQAVILAGGKGTRMGELTRHIPKPLLRVGGKNLLEHKIDVLPSEIDEIIIVVGHLGNKIREYFGNSYKSRKITFVEQGDPLGTAHALFETRDLITGRFLSMMGDDIYGPKSIQNVMEHPFAISTIPSPGFAGIGKVQINEGGYIADILFSNKDEGGMIRIENGLYSLTPDIFNFPMVKIPGKEEYGLPYTILAQIKNGTIKLKTTEADYWIKINSPEDLVTAENILREKND